MTTDWRTRAANDRLGNGYHWMSKPATDSGAAIS
jgi:hypothetical protein